MKIIPIFIISIIMFYISPYENLKLNRSNIISHKMSTDYGMNDYEKSFKPTIKSLETLNKDPDLDIDSKHVILYSQSKQQSGKSLKLNKLRQDIDSQLIRLEVTSKKSNLNHKSQRLSYWETLYSIESKQGLLLFRPSNKSRNCSTTSAACGHHQLTTQALRDIGCKSSQCKADRLNYVKSLAMSKKLHKINKHRMLKKGHRKLPEYQEYLIHQQGAAGIGIILAASKGKKLLSKTIKRNMASNSPYSYKDFKKMGSKLAANTFMNYWQTKWNKEKNQSVVSKDIKTILPLLSEYELQLALNIKF